jgi:hypothetical protein
MTRDPKRWLEPGSGATDFERDLLDAAHDHASRAFEKQAIWAALAMKLPTIPEAAATTSAPVASAVAKSGALAGGKASLGSALLKTTLIVAVSAGGAAITTRAVLRSPEHEPSLQRIHRQLRAPTSEPIAQDLEENAPDAEARPDDTPPPAQKQAPIPRRTMPVIVRAPESPAEQTVTPRRPVEKSVAHGRLEEESVARRSPRDDSPRITAPPATEPEPKMHAQSHLAEEIMLLADANRRLARGDAQGALETIRAADVRFPKGALEEERRALLVQALAEIGDRAAARAEALRFARDFPSSPYVTRVCALDRCDTKP